MSITLKNANVNSGTAVDIFGNIVNYTLKSNNNHDPVPGKRSSSPTTDGDIVEGEKGTIENPILVIRGEINIDDNADSNEMTEKLLKAFWRDREADTTLTLKIGGVLSGSSEYRISNFAGDNAADDNIKVNILTISMQFPNTVEKNHYIVYTITMTEEK